MNWHVDATVLISLAGVDAVGLLRTLDGPIVVLDAVRDEVKGEPEATVLDEFVEEEGVVTGSAEASDRALDVLGDESFSGDAALVAVTLAADGDVGVVSDDRRIRTTTGRLGASVTGTVGVLVRAVAVDEIDVGARNRLVDRLDQRGLHMTAELRVRAHELIEEAGEGRVE